MVADLIKPVIGTNCVPDTDKFISTLKSIGKNPTIRPPQTVLPVTKSYTTIFIEIPEQNTLAYIAGYLCRRCLSVHDCVNCKAILVSHETYLSDQSQLFIHHKAYNTTQSDFGSLFLPSDAFFALLQCV